MTEEFDIGERYREIREARGWTQENLSDESKQFEFISRENISDFEKSRHSTTIRKLKKYLRPLNCTLEEFFTRKVDRRKKKRAYLSGNDDKRKSYGRRPYDHIWDGTSDAQRERIRNAVIVLTSDDEVTKTALEHNIIAFHRTIVLLRSKGEGTL